MKRAFLLFEAATKGAVPASAVNAAQKLRTRDITLAVPCNEGKCRITFCTSRNVLVETIMRHKLLETTRVHLPFWQMLGSNLSFTNMLASQLEGEERVNSRFTTQEATLEVEALALGECRAYLSRAYNGELLSAGTAAFPLMVERIRFNQLKPFTSIVNADLSSLVQLREAEERRENRKSNDTASTNDNSNSDDDSISIPHELYVPGMNAALLQGYFHYNMTLHAYHFLRQSDGICSPAVWLHTGMNRDALTTSSLLSPLDLSRLSERGEMAMAAMMEKLKHTISFQGGRITSVSSADKKAQNEDEREKEVEYLRTALTSAVTTSFGAMIQPLGAGNTLSRELWKLQQLLVAGVAACQVGEVKEEVEAYIRSPSLYSLLHTDNFHDYACQNVLSILTGDVEKSFQVARNARQCTQDPSHIAPTIEAIRRELQLNDLTLTLDMQVEDAKRCAVDFFCRCSPDSLLDALKSLPELNDQKVCGQVFRCSKCSKEYHLMLPKEEKDTTVESETPPSPSTAEENQFSHNK